MEKKCFVIMPISDCDGYPSGHFKRVYDFLIAPAVKLAGFEPIRADDIMTTNYIALDILKKIIEFDMALCDLSSRNPNVLYELGIRQAFNLPVTFIKDTRTNRIFDIQGFRDVEYDESLRIDTVQKEIEDIALIIKNTYENKHEVNSLISLLSIEPARITEKKKISIDTELILNSLSVIDKKIIELENKFYSDKSLNTNIIWSTQNVNEYLSFDELKNLKKDDKVYNTAYGEGKFVKMLTESKSYGPQALFKFNDGNERKFFLKLAKFKKTY